MDAATWLWGLIGLFVILPVVTLLFFLLARDNLVNDSVESLSEVKVNEGETNEQTAYVPPAYGQELKQQLKISLKFGLVVQLGLVIMIIFVNITGFMSDLLDSNLAPLAYGLIYLPPILYGYSLVNNKLDYRNIIVPISTVVMGLTLYILYKLSQATPPTYFNEPKPVADFSFELLQIVGMVFFAPVVTLIVHPLMIRRNNKYIDVKQESGSSPTAQM